MALAALEQQSAHPSGTDWQLRAKEWVSVQEQTEKWKSCSMMLHH